MLAIVIDDAHLMDLDSLRRLQLLLEDFPKNHSLKNHSLILVAQPGLLTTLSLTVNDDIESRVTYSVLMQKLNPDDIESFIKNQLDRVALSHATFTPEAMQLIARSSEGALRATKNLCIGALLEAVRDRTRTVDLKQVNRVLLQPHWRRREDMLS
jgi:MSHA biogenesis protein MshM